MSREQVKKDRGASHEPPRSLLLLLRKRGSDSGFALSPLVTLESLGGESGTLSLRLRCAAARQAGERGNLSRRAAARVGVGSGDTLLRSGKSWRRLESSLAFNQT